MLEKRILIFNNNDGSFCAEISVQDADMFTLEEYTLKPIEYDISKFRWDGGNLLRGKLVSFEDLDRRIEKDAMNSLCRRVILQEYPKDDQLNNISAAILEIAEYLNLSGDAVSKLKEQEEFIIECKETNQRFINAYKNDPYWDYVSGDDTLSFLRDNPTSSEFLGVHSIDI